MRVSVNPSGLAEILTHAISEREPILITGRPGIGKSDIVGQVTQSLNQKLILRHAVTDEPTDYKGLGFAKSDTEAAFLIFGDLKEMINATEPTVVFIDDIGPAPTGVQAALMQLILARRINGHQVSDLVTFIAATNRREDLAGVNSMITPLVGRFTVLDLEMTVDDWVQWALRTDIPIELIAACRFFPKWLTDWTPSRAIENTPTPRNMGAVGRLMKWEISDHLRLPLFAGRMGHAAATELIGFLDTYKDLPTIDDIIRDPSTAKLPDNPAGKYAISVALAAHVKESTFPQVVSYMERLEKEFEALFMKDVASHNSTLCENITFINWAAKNHQYII